MKDINDAQTIPEFIEGIPTRKTLVNDRRKLIENYYAKHWYMNFTVKLTIGINGEGKYIQYSVNKVEINKNRFER